MTDKEILKKAVEKAENNGYQLSQYIKSLFIKHDIPSIQYFTDVDLHFLIIFSHEFAKAFWGEKLLVHVILKGGGMIPKILSWEYHLQQIVLKEEPLKYLEKFLDG